MIGIKKLFEFRNSSAKRHSVWGDDQEKPFLDHLEDLRWMLLKVIITLVVAVLGCFIFHQQVFDIVLKPMRAATEFKSTSLPKNIDKTRWERAKLWTQTLGSFTDETQRAVFLEELALRDKEYLETKNDRFNLVGGSNQEPIPIESLLRIAAAYRAASVLFQEAGLQYKRKKIAPPEEFFARMLTPQEQEFAIELWKRGARSEPSPLTEVISMLALGPTEPFMISMKMSLYAAIVVSFPVLLFFLAEFILPGITQRERKVLYQALAVGFGLFLIGVLFAYFIVVPRALHFFQDWGAQLGLAEQWQIGKYVSFVTQMTLIFGLCFELPVVVLSLLKLGLVSVKMLREGRLWGYGIILVSAALITPTTDAFTLGLLAGPMLILYEITILIGAAMERKERAEALAAEAKYKERRLQPALDDLDEEQSAKSEDNEQTRDSNKAGSSALPYLAAQEAVPTPKPRTNIHAQEKPNHSLSNQEDEDDATREECDEELTEEETLKECDNEGEDEDSWLEDPWAEDAHSLQDSSAWSEDFRPEEDDDEIADDEEENEESEAGAEEKTEDDPSQEEQK